MTRKIEDAFNDCFERLLSGESLDSCISTYPQYAAELHAMLHTAFEVKRRAFPVQPRPEFKYWSRIRMQGTQDSIARQHVPAKSTSFGMRRNLAISIAAVLVFVIATSGTAAASYDALPDQPLYGIKLAVEQVEVTLTTSDTAKAELYATFAEKRAGEIAVMADQGKTDKVVTVTERMYRQLDLAEQLMAASETEIAGYKNAAKATTMTAPSVSAPSGAAGTPPTITPAPAAVPPPIVTPSTGAASTDHQEESQTTAGSKQQVGSIEAVTRAKTSINAANAKTLTILQKALDKAPESIRPSLNAVIERTKKSNEILNKRSSQDRGQLPSSSGSVSDNDTDIQDPDDGKSDNGRPVHLPDRSKITNGSDHQPGIGDTMTNKTPAVK